MKTIFPKVKDIEKKWYIINAKDKVLGRLASKVATLLIGKNKTYFSPHMDCGDFVIIINSDSVKLTGNKLNNKYYHKHSGYPGGLKSTKYIELFKKGKSDFIIQKAVKGMLKHSPLGYRQLKHLKIYKKESHPHDSQNPIPLSI